MATLLDNRPRRRAAGADHPLARRLAREASGDVLFSLSDRGRYATDASFYQIMPTGVFVPRTTEAALTALAIAREEGVAVTARGGGTSQCGQTVNSGLVLDTSKHLNRVLDFDKEARTVVVEPGLVLDDLNRWLKPHGLWFPVDVSTASRATLGGMAGNNSCGGRSLRYGTMRDNTIALDACLADGSRVAFGPASRRAARANEAAPGRDLMSAMLALGTREADEIRARFPKVQRRVGGYNLDALLPEATDANLAHLLVGSEGTLAFTTRLELKLWPVIRQRGVGVVHFGSFYRAMDAAQHIVKLRPIAVELVDRTMIGLGRDIPMFRPTVDAVVRGDPDALLVVEFAEANEPANLMRLKELDQLVADLGFSWAGPRERQGGVVEVMDAGLQARIAEFRTAGLNVMMSMREAGKPVSFIEDCAVPLEHLADYTARLTAIFERHGTRGTWYAHASEGCLHVRPVLNLKLDKDVKTMRAVAEEAFAMVREYKGSHSGEHGDGIVRSEFHEAMFGARLVAAFGEVKRAFDPTGFYNPGKIVDPPRMDDRTLFRYSHRYRESDMVPALDWSAWPGGARGLQGAAEMCNNNGACRAAAGGVMCPSYRATRDEAHVTRGRANTLRLALSGQLGPDGLVSDEVKAALALCVSCKGCKRECPTGVDMARLKIEVLAARAAAFGPSLRDRLVAYMPRYAPLARRVPWLFNARDRVPGLAWLSEKLVGLAASRPLPTWRRDVFAPAGTCLGPQQGREVVLLADTFNRAFERENLEAALSVLLRAGYRVHLPRAVDGSTRPLCCGRTFLSAGLVGEARRELDRTMAALAPLAARGAAIVGLEPSCLLTLRDEIQALRPGKAADDIAGQALLFEEFIAREADAGHFKLPLAPIADRALLHGHCHQKAFGAMGAVARTLALIPGLQVETVESSCCGMAGSFGYQAETVAVSRAMGELSLLPAVRNADAAALIVADGTSCRHQIADGTGRKAVHVAIVLARSADAAAAPMERGEL
ncbi:MAG: FAD-linked oxidase C-terminal domain-containing protein [Hyphomicrobiaceae bacterium]|nr:FAD-linked oxidase C-terminal domain-containing protein [Hyphomicrobiaceae bacterium]